MFCKNCGKEYSNGSFCMHCGTPHGNSEPDTAIPQQAEKPRFHCPCCGSTRLNIISSTEVSTQTKGGFSFFRGCIGYLCLGPFGILCGACRKSKTKTSVKSKNAFICMNCSKKSRDLDAIKADIETFNSQHNISRILAIFFCCIAFLYAVVSPPDIIGSLFYLDEYAKYNSLFPVLFIIFIELCLLSFYIFDIVLLARNKSANWFVLSLPLLMLLLQILCTALPGIIGRAMTTFSSFIELIFSTIGICMCIMSCSKGSFSTIEGLKAEYEYIRKNAYESI